MQDQYTVAEIVSAFKELYHTIDVRAALLKHEDRWRSICVAIRLNSESAESASQKFQELQERYGKLEAKPFQILQYCFLFQEFDSMVAALKEERLLLGNRIIPLDKAIDILSLPGRIDLWLPHSVRPRAALDWPVLRASTQLSNWDTFHRLLQGNREILRCVEMSGYHDPYSAIRHLLEIDFGSGSPATLVVEPAVPARLEVVRVITKPKDRVAIDIFVMAHQAAAKLCCTVRHERRDPEQRLVRQQAFSLNPGQAEGTFRRWIGSVELESAEGGWSDDDWIYLEVVHEEIGRLYSQGYRFRELLRPEERNPLFVALTKFCPWEHIKGLLESPDIVQPPRDVSLKQKGRLFEVSIQWLLSSLGFRSVWLHGYEKLKEGEFDYGSIDCLAYHDRENVLLLVNCTTGPPDPHEINRQLELEHLMLRKVFYNTTVRLKSVLFSASHNPESERVHYAPERVKIFYREDITKLLALIGSGQEKRILDAIFSPSFQSL